MLKLYGEKKAMFWLGGNRWLPLSEEAILKCKQVPPDLTMMFANSYQIGDEDGIQRFVWELSGEDDSNGWFLMEVT